MALMRNFASKTQLQGPFQGLFSKDQDKDKDLSAKDQDQDFPQGPGQGQGLHFGP